MFGGEGVEVGIYYKVRLRFALVAEVPGHHLLGEWKVMFSVFILDCLWKTVPNHLDVSFSRSWISLRGLEEAGFEDGNVDSKLLKF